MTEKIARIIQETFFPHPPTRWETMAPYQQQEFLDCAAEITGRVLTASQQGPFIRLDYATTEEASAAFERFAPSRAALSPPPTEAVVGMASRDHAPDTCAATPKSAAPDHGDDL